MKVIFKNLIQGYTGKADDYVIYYNRRLNCVIMRERPVYRNHPAHSPFRVVMKNLKKLNPSQAYRIDAAAYVEHYNKLPQNRNCNLVSWANLYQKIMWMLKRVYPEVDLATLTRQQITDESLPCHSIKAAVDAGLLPKVKGYEALESEM
jgi:hypothetical protein